MRMSIAGLSRRFDDVTVLHGLDLDLADGQTAAVLGDSGSGKTTLLRLVAGLDVPDAGTIQMDGQCVSRPGWALEPHRRGLGFAFQSAALWPHMTVAQNVLFGVPHTSGNHRAPRLARLLEQLELDGLAQRYPDQLSGGQCRRVGLARALAPEPGLLLLDEPLTNLQPDLRRRVLAVLRAEAERTGATVLYVTHDRSEVADMGAAVYRMTEGRLVPEPGESRPGRRGQ
jgi:ABC-type sulfate/molybdate transport systems ATPase subunit